VLMRCDGNLRHCGCCRRQRPNARYQFVKLPSRRRRCGSSKFNRRNPHPQQESDQLRPPFPGRQVLEQPGMSALQAILFHTAMWGSILDTLV
jgi:hypothetical protein